MLHVRGPLVSANRSHIVNYQVYLKDLVLDDHARKKLIELVEDRYDSETDELTIVADRYSWNQKNTLTLQHVLHCINNDLYLLSLLDMSDQFIKLSPKQLLREHNI